MALLSLALPLTACGDLKPRCGTGGGGNGDAAPMVADGGSLGTGRGTPACADEDGAEPRLENSAVVICGAEHWAVQTCTRTAVGLTTCERACALVDRSAPYCDAAGDAMCSNGAEASCEVVALPTEAECKAMLERCEADERVSAPTGAGLTYSGCAFGRGFNFEREVMGDASIL